MSAEESEHLRHENERLQQELAAIQANVQSSDSKTQIKDLRHKLEREKHACETQKTYLYEKQREVDALKSKLVKAHKESGGDRAQLARSQAEYQILVGFDYTNV